MASLRCNKYQPGFLILLASVFFAFQSDVVYSVYDEYTVIIPGWISSQERMAGRRQSSVQLKVQGTGEAVGFYKFELVRSGREQGPPKPSFFQLSQTVQDFQKSVSVPLNSNLYGLLASFKTDALGLGTGGKGGDHAVLLAAQEDFGVCSPISTHLRASLDRNEATAAPRSSVTSEELNFAYRLKQRSTLPSSGSELKAVIQEMFGANEYAIDGIRRHWLSRLVVYYVEQLDLFRNLKAPEKLKAGEEQHMIVTGTIKADQSCHLRFRIQNISIAADKKLLITGQEGAGVYEVADGFAFRFLCLTGEKEGEFDIQEWIPQTEHLQPVYGSYKLGARANRVSPFYVSGWHRTPRAGNTEPANLYQYSYVPGIDANWDVKVESENAYANTTTTGEYFSEKFGGQFAGQSGEQMAGGLAPPSMGMKKSKSASNIAGNPKKYTTAYPGLKSASDSQRNGSKSRTNQTRSSVEGKKTPYGQLQSSKFQRQMSKSAEYLDVVGLNVVGLNAKSATAGVGGSGEELPCRQFAQLAIDPENSRVMMQKIAGFELSEAIEHKLLHQKEDWFGALDYESAQTALGVVGKVLGRYGNHARRYKEKTKTERVKDNTGIAHIGQTSHEILSRVANPGSQMEFFSFCSAKFCFLKAKRIIGFDFPYDGCCYCSDRKEPELPPLISNYQRSIKQ